MAYLHLPMNLLLSSLLLTLLFNSTSVAAWKSSASFPSQQLVPRPTSYIVHTLNTSRPAHILSQTEWYRSLIELLPNSQTPNATVTKPQIFYEYQTVMQGFAATLTPEEAQIISEHDGVIRVYRDQLSIELQTTHSPDFIGLSTYYGIWQESNLGDDVIIGLVDTGIWPESQSFNDSGLLPVGSRWKGKCENGTRFNSSMCNNKLIGARYFNAGAKALGFQVGDDDNFTSPRDQAGHGTHTSSTAAGSPVLGASLFGKANGTARGLAPKAKIAMYRVCWHDVCTHSDILAGMEKAIEDGVDILSISLGTSRWIPYYEDSIAIGSFAAARHGIFVACAAGNSGPRHNTVGNTAPWVTTVAAGSIDRTFTANVTLGSGEVLFGESLYFEVMNGMDMLPIISIELCYDDTLVPSVIMGKIVVCPDAWVGTGFLIEAAGGAGLISINGDPSAGETIVDESYTLPSLMLGYDEGRKLLAYLNSTTRPTARLNFDGHTIIGKKRAPQVAVYSSRGPSYEVPELPKPDILAPGNNILAAWPSEVPLSDDPIDPRRSDFNILSGTSMATPHVAGAAALLRHMHPTWSPAMLRSAMVTTALVLDNRDRTIIANENSQDATPLAFGAGHVYPQAANDPGLVYDTGFEDYVKWLCKLNYTSKQMGSFVPSPVNCSDAHSDPNWDLNYPSFGVVFKNQTRQRVVRRRTLTKVSDLPENYTARVVNLVQEKVEVIVKPEMLDFIGPFEKRGYTVEFTSKVSANASFEYGFAYIIWENEEHQVKSPVVFIWSTVPEFNSYSG
ncbi:Subtilisin-like protease SBT1.7 [Rhynchospora pubera]|uniref:Subtilisin-like protease SBT1.7 n=1 Tax=Rhynchospora pubera TaxID=906938 RepID=A0AAV8F849_9POAL|nr:Subtilisin-like protease SBT1.7 [Rhynchospora pubera]